MQIADTAATLSFSGFAGSSSQERAAHLADLHWTSGVGEVSMLTRNECLFQMR
jgi:hypothetical protein